jgi:hypothetical protein
MLSTKSGKIISGPGNGRLIDFIDLSDGYGRLSQIRPICEQMLK